MRRIAAHYLINRGEILPHPIITLSDEGVIEHIGQWQELDSIPQTEFYAGVLCPGFVNAHCHIELSYLKGAIESGSGFAGFARQIGTVRGGFTPQEREQALRAADATLWAQGVDAVADIANGATSMPMKQRSHIRYTTFAELFGLNSTFEPIDTLRKEWPEVIPTPHSTYSLQDGLFRQSIEASTVDSPLSIHFMESEAEAALYRGEGSLYEWYERMGWRCDFLAYGSPAKRIVESIPSERRIMLVHNCFVGREDIELLNAHFHQRVSWVVCPRSNDYISGIKPPVELLREMGCRICIGTDSLASNNGLEMIEEMKCFKHIPLREVVTWVTQNGAEALNLHSELGCLVEGRPASIVLLEAIDTSPDGELWLTTKTTSRRLAGEGRIQNSKFKIQN